MFPSDRVSGLELSWSFEEGNIVDGEDEVRARTCAGFDVDAVEVSITDHDDAERHATFVHGCEQGFQTLAEVQTSLSDAFILLREGDYEVELRAVDDAGRTVLEEQLEAKVDRIGVTLLPLLLVPPLLDWTLELTLDACEDVRFDLVYDDPSVALVNTEANDDDDNEDENDDGDDQEAPLPYRDSLVSEEGLALGMSIACDALAGSAHHFVGIDRGRYQLLVSKDGMTCRIPLTLDENTTTTVNLANLACSG